MEENIFYINGVAVTEEEFKAQLEKDCATRGHIENMRILYPTYMVFSPRESGKSYAKKLQEEFQRGKECECRSIVARLKNKFETLGYGTIVFKEPVNGRYGANLEDICNCILEDLDNA